MMENFSATQVFRPAFHTIAGLLTFAAAGAFALALTAQGAGALAPGPVWLVQRWAYGVVVALGIATRFTEDRRLEAWLVAVMGLVLLAGVAMAVFRIGA